MEHQFANYLNRFADDFDALHEKVSGKHFTLEDVEEILKQQPQENDFVFAGRCRGVFHAYAFAANHYAEFQKLGFITSLSAITPELMFMLYLFFGGKEAPPEPQTIKLELFINAVKQRQQNQGSA